MRSWEDIVCHIYALKDQWYSNDWSCCLCCHAAVCWQQKCSNRNVRIMWRWWRLISWIWLWQEEWWRWLEGCTQLRPDDTLHVQAKATTSWFPQINNNSYASREARTEKENLTLRHCKRHRAGGGERLLSGFSSVWASSLLVVLSSFPSANTTTGFNHLLFPSWLIVHNLGTINPLMFDSSAKYQWVTMFCCQSIEDE